MLQVLMSRKIAKATSHLSKKVAWQSFFGGMRTNLNKVHMDKKEIKP
jgi:hypothetical protein